jgi:hypothetical protein
MRIVEGGEPIALVVPGVVAVADADQRRLQEIDDGGQHLLARQAAQRHMRRHPGANPRQGLGEVNEMLIFRAFADLAKGGVIAVLLAAARIAPGRLEMAAGVGRDPDIGPGRRDRSERMRASVSGSRRISPSVTPWPSRR